MTEPLLHLPMVVSAEDVESPDARIRCKPYSAVLSARNCVARRDAATGAGKAAQRPGEAFRRDSVVGRGDYGLCRACPVGEVVRRRVGHLVDAPPAALAVVPALPRLARAPRTRRAATGRRPDPPVTKTRQRGAEAQESPAAAPVPKAEESGMRQVQMNGAAPAGEATVPAVKPKRAKAQKPKAKRQGPRHCGVCGSTKHDTRTCPRPGLGRADDGTHESRGTSTTATSSRTTPSSRAKAPRTREGEDFLSLRLPADLTAQVDRLAENLSIRALGIKVDRSEVFRLVIRRGLEVLAEAMK